MPDRDYDIVLFGATGFVGQRAVRYLARSPETAALRWAIAGRDADRLEALKASVGEGAQAAHVLVADTRDPRAVESVVGQTRVLANLAGPFALYGGPVVDACVRLRTHYVDITGETVWVRGLVDRYHDRAQADGTRIVPCCGFDSVPADLGCFLVAAHMRRTLGVGCSRVTAYYQMYGGFNGGTVASNLLRHESGAFETGRNPFLLNPEDAQSRDDIERNADPVGARFDKEIGTWVGPFIMGPINTRVVRRSAALYGRWGEPYGARFRYQEYTRFDPPFAHAKAVLVSGAMAAFDRAMEGTRMRRLLVPLLPKPGEGPSEKTMATGWFTCALVGFTEDGRKVTARIADKGDPSNRVTAKCVCESALGLARNAGALPGGAQRGGVLTPATALGNLMVRRLRNAQTLIEIDA